MKCSLLVIIWFPLSLLADNIPDKTTFYYAPASLCKQKDSLKTHSPTKATILSGILPGAGQAYNRKYWKIPIVYAGLGALGYSVFYNRKQTRSFQEALTYRLDNDPNTTDTKYANYSDAQVRSERDFYRSNRDLSIVGFFLMYTLNIVDAAVDAHLYKFDVNQSLSSTNNNPKLKIAIGGTGKQPSLGLNFSF